MPDGTFAFRAAFVALVLGMAVGFVWALRRAGQRLGEAPRDTLRVTGIGSVGVALWLAFTGRLAASGFLAFQPPTLPPLLVLGLVGTVVLAFSRVGARLANGLPIEVLVGYQAFRIAVELLLHRGHVEGLVPVQLTYLGLNFDVLTGALALLLVVLARLGPLPRLLLAVWNLIGFGLLANVVTIALLSAPTPMRVFWNEPANVWIARAPFIWLPTFLVPMALLGHLLVLRWLFAHPRRQRGGVATAGAGTGDGR